jgi:hypothetical protein
MIKIGKNTKDVKLGNKQVLKVYKGTDVVWEKETKEIKEDIVLERKNANLKYFIGIGSSEILKLNTNYRLKTDNPSDEYTIKANGKKYLIKDGSVFMAKKEDPWLSIENNSGNYFKLTIYKTTSKATTIII